MYKRILVPTDGSEITAKAVASAVQLAGLVGAEIFALAVKEPFPYSAISEMQPVPPQEFFDTQERIARKHLQTVSEACAAAKVACTPVSVEAPHPWEAILDHAIQSLTRRITELQAAGIPIRREDRKHPLTGQRYARYFLA